MKTPILVFGAGGLLGSWLCRKYPDKVVGLTRSDCDITNHRQVEKIITTYKPTAIINAAGIVRKRADDPQLYRVNSFAPHRIADLCEQHLIRFIHVSTDCVFSGERGNYTENDAPDPYDSYGVSKAAGEISNSPHLTVRCSFIGWPDPTGHGLLSWLINHKDEKVAGYTEYIWNGLTVSVLADCLVKLAGTTQTGIMHLFGETISKYDLLVKLNHVYDLGKTIEPVATAKHDMTLATIRDDQPVFGENVLAKAAGERLTVFPLLQMLGEMRFWEKIEYGH